MANTDGNTSNVANVATASPPTTARPSGAVCCPPSPKPKAIGIMPAIMAKLAIRIRTRANRYALQVLDVPHHRIERHHRILSFDGHVSRRTDDIGGGDGRDDFVGRHV